MQIVYSVLTVDNRWLKFSGIFDSLNEFERLMFENKNMWIKVKIFDIVETNGMIC